MERLHQDSDKATPIIFVLSSGADPTNSIFDFARKKGMFDKLKSISLGQGQGKKAEMLIENGKEEGHWVFLANCHLAKSFMPRLEVLVEELGDDDETKY